MSKLSALKAATTLKDVADILGYSAKGLSYILYKTPDAIKYVKFDIPKKAGGVRTISAPIPPLKAVQKKLADLLYKCREELEKATPRKSLSFGFRKNHTIIGNAQGHKRRRYVLNLDIANFFSSFNFGRVRGFFITNKDFGLSEKVATILAQIACFENGLPQGSPCSPVIADMIAHILDVRLVQLAKKHRVTYSRYVDDLTFSTSQKLFPLGLAVTSAEEEGGWTVGTALTKAIERCGLQINPAKTRMQVRPGRQTVTGLSVNEKVNITSDYWRGVRSMCRALFTTGMYHKPFPTGEAAASHKPMPLTSLAPLAGRMTHIRYVKKNVHDASAPDTKTPIPGQTLQFRFWFYAFFVGLMRPLIVCEGITDKIYLKNAIKHSAKHGLLLSTPTASGSKLAVDIFNYDNKIHEILSLTGGSGILSGFTKKYAGNVKRYSFCPLEQPVIVIVDNDDGLKDIKAELKRTFGHDINLAAKEPFYHLVHNLYLIKTPEIGADGTSCIESFLPDAILTTPLSGKIFSPDKHIDTATQIGKVPFAKKVVSPNADHIDWSGFEPLLERIVLAIADYGLKVGKKGH